MSELRDLYQEVILDHNKSPHNFGPLPDATATADGHNPLCGDRLRLYLRLEGDRIAGVSFEGSGCAISKASASLMTDAVKGKNIAEVGHLFDRVRAMLTSDTDEASIDDEELGSLAVLSGVREFPMRVKCASLAWHTLKSALAGTHETAKTE